MSAASESVSRMPRRISAWSSQRMTRIIGRALRSYIGPLAGVVRLVRRLGDVRALGRAERHREDQGCAVRPAREVDPAADRRRALLQATDAERARLGQVFLADAAAVVGDLEREYAAGEREVDLHAGRLRVLADVGQRLLRGAVGDERNALRQLERLLGQPQVAD